MKAKMQSADERLIEIARECLAKEPRSQSKARELLETQICTDAALLWEYFKDFRKGAADRLFTKTREKIHAEERKRHRGGKSVASASHCPVDTHPKHAGATYPGAGAKNLTPHGQPSIAPAPGRPRSIATDIAALRPAIQRTILDTFLVTDYHKKHQIPIGDLNVSGLLKRAASAGRYAWVSAREREVYLMIAAAASKQAHIPRNSRVRDIFEPRQVQEWVEMAGATAVHPDLSSFRETFKAENPSHA